MWRIYDDWRCCITIGVMQNYWGKCVRMGEDHHALVGVFRNKLFTLVVPSHWGNQLSLGQSGTVVPRLLKTTAARVPLLTCDSLRFTWHKWGSSLVLSTEQSTVGSYKFSCSLTATMDQPALSCKRSCL